MCRVLFAASEQLLCCPFPRQPTRHIWKFFLEDPELWRMETKSRLIGENFSQLSLHRWLKSVSWHHQALLFWCCYIRSLKFWDMVADWHSRVWFQTFLWASSLMGISLSEWHFPWRQTARRCISCHLPECPEWVHIRGDRMKSHLYLVLYHPLDSFCGEDCPFLSVMSLSSCPVSFLKGSPECWEDRVKRMIHCVQRSP